MHHNSVDAYYSSVIYTLLVCEDPQITKIFFFLNKCTLSYDYCHENPQQTTQLLFNLSQLSLTLVSSFLSCCISGRV